MKYAITGHTSGIGEALYNQLAPDAIGFSLTSGYDIRDQTDRKRIIKESADCDIFINNAPADFAQSELLVELWREWRNTDKTIINVGSRIADDNINLSINEQHLLEYSMHKRTLRTLCDDLTKIQTDVTVKYVTFAYVGIPRILEKYPHFTPDDYITVDAAIKIILT